MGQNRLELVEAKLALLQQLSGIVTGPVQQDNVDVLLSEWPCELAVFTVRASLVEILTATAVCHTGLSHSLRAWICRAISALPQPPIHARISVAADVASRLLLEQQGLHSAARQIAAIPLPPAPQQWPDLGLWAADTSPLALVDLSTPIAGQLVGRELDLSRAACLAASGGRFLSCARMLRWTGFCEVSAVGGFMAELLYQLDARMSNEPDVTFQLSVARHHLHLASVRAT